MECFKETTHLADILDESQTGRVAIFKYSSQCGSSARLSAKIEELVHNGKIKSPIFKVTVQTHPALSKKIEEWFGIKHESPQMIIVENGTAVYSASHTDISLEFLTT